jgi:hypothetical protein
MIVTKLNKQLVVPNWPTSATSFSFLQRDTCNFHPMLNSTAAPVKELHHMYLNACDVNQCLISSGEFTYICAINITTLDKCIHQADQMSVYNMNIFLAQEGVGLNMLSAQEGVALNIYLISVATTQSNNGAIQFLETLQTYLHKILGYILYKYFQFLLIYQNVCKIWHLSTFELDVIYCCSQMYILIYKKCRIIWIFLMHFICKCHDFKVYLQTILSIHLVTNTFILGYCISLFFTIFNCSFDNCSSSLAFKQYPTQHKSGKKNTYCQNVMANKKTQQVNLSNSCLPSPPFEFVENFMKGVWSIISL